MATYKAQVAIYPDSGLLRDAMVNTFHFESSDSAEVLSEVPAQLALLYDGLGVFSSLVRQNGHTIKIYNLADPEPRAPIYDGTFNLTTNPTGNPLPQEVALCMSFQGDRLSGERQARRRGRVYFGEFHTGGLATSGGPHSDLITTIAAFGNELLFQSGTWVSTKWVVWSEADAASVLITGGWVDNAWDTQRRRGIDATLRTTFDGS